MAGFRGIYNRFMSFRQGLRERSTDRRMAYHGQNKPSTLLIIKPDAIGDYMLFRRFLEEIRHSERYHHITLCGNVLWKDLALAFDAGYVDHFIWFQPARLAEPGYKRSLEAELYALGAETVIYPCYSRTAEGDDLALRSGAGKKITFRGDARNIHPARKARNDSRYQQLIDVKDTLAFEFYRYRDFFEQCLGTTLLHTSPALLQEGATPGKIVFCPGASAAWRRWSAGHFYSLALSISQRSPKPCTFYICGSAQDATIAAAIVACGHAVQFTDLTGSMNLEELARFMGDASLVVANDSGPMHIAAACGVHVLALSNGNNYGRFIPYPAALAPLLKTLFPPDLHAFLGKPGSGAWLQQHDAPFDINTIGVEEALAAIAALPGLL